MKNLLETTELKHIQSIIARGGIIAYPTEAVYGLGCHPFIKTAVLRLLEVKKRDLQKGLLIICSSWEQILPLIHKPPDDALTQVYKSWPGPMTWIFPARSSVPPWITGEHQQVAIRMTNHPIAKTLCNFLNKPIVSTSANLTGHLPLHTASAVKQIFGDKIDYIVEGQVGPLTQPTPIRDVVTGQIIRE